MSRFGQHSLEEIDNTIGKSIPSNTVKSKASMWRQFSAFCEEKNHKLEADTTEEGLADILKDWGYNMKKTNGEDYKESVVKTMWNGVAKQLQEKYSNEFKREIDPFKGLKFKAARDARDSKRRVLQVDPEKMKKSATALESSEIGKMIDVWDEDTPEGLQKKFFVIASVELAWRGGEGSTALVHHFREETKNDGSLSGRIEYNPILSKTAQGGAKKTASSKWLSENTADTSKCPVRLFRKLLSRRGDNIKSDRLFLTANAYWQKTKSKGWFKDVPVGRNMFSQWLKESAQKAGLDTEGKKITNHSSRATAVSSLAKAGVSDQQIMKMTGHANVNSIKPYLQLDSEHHGHLVKKMRTDNGPTASTSHTSTSAMNATTVISTASAVGTSVSAAAAVSSSVSCPGTSDLPQTNKNIYNNCVFNCTNLHIN